MSQTVADFVCSVCGSKQRSQGWLDWHQAQNHASAPGSNPAAVVPGNKINTRATTATTPEGAGEAARDKRVRVKPAAAWVECSMCGHSQNIIFAVGNPPERHRCIWCRELQPMDGYRQIAYGWPPVRILSPAEVKANLHEPQL